MRRLSIAVACALLPSCAPPPVVDRTAIPEWYKVRFRLHYPDGRRYEGECFWPDYYYDLLQHDIRVSRGLVKPGKSVLSVREVHGPKAFEFTPHGRGTMTYPDGTVKAGAWVDGEFAREGPVPHVPGPPEPRGDPRSP